MEAKKNKTLQQERNSSLYFVFGLCLVLTLTYIALEWKTFHDKSGWEVAELDKPDVLSDEEAPFIKPPEPPKPKFIPVINDPLPDDADVEEDILDFIEPDINTKVPNIPEIEYVKDDIPEEVIFTAVEKKPIFPGCEGASDKYACFQHMIQKHIGKNFRYPERAIEMNQQGKVYVQFTIQKDGSIDGIRLRGPHKLLENEAKRIISKLPQMTPGKQRGTPVKVPFSIPINFVLQ